MLYFGVRTERDVYGEAAIDALRRCSRQRLVSVDRFQDDDGDESDGDVVAVGPGIERSNEASSKFKHEGQQLSRVESWAS